MISKAKSQKNARPVKLSYYDRLKKLFRFLVFLMCYSVDMMSWAGRASLVTMNQEVFNTSSEYEGSRKSGGFFEPKKILREDPEHLYSNPRFVQAITNKIWKRCCRFCTSPLLSSGGGTLTGTWRCAYRGELILFDCSDSCWPGCWSPARCRKESSVWARLNLRKVFAKLSSSWLL